MIAALVLEFFIIYLFADFAKFDQSKRLSSVYEWLKIIWSFQAAITLTYLAWKYLP